MCPLRSNQDPAPSERSPLPRKLKSCNTGGLDLTGKAAVLKTAGRKPVEVRILCPPLHRLPPLLAPHDQKGFDVIKPVPSSRFRPRITATLSVRNWDGAVAFYKAAFGATELYRA